MSSKRRRWLTVFGFLMTTALGAVLSYLFSRRARWARERSPEEASVPELSARLRRKALLQEERLHRGRLAIPWPPAWSRDRSLQHLASDSSGKGEEALIEGSLERGSRQDVACPSDSA